MSEVSLIFENTFQLKNDKYLAFRVFSVAKIYSKDFQMNKYQRSIVPMERAIKANP
jgi:hypothetical protein